MNPFYPDCSIFAGFLLPVPVSPLIVTFGVSGGEHELSDIADDRRFVPLSLFLLKPNKDSIISARQILIKAFHFFLSEACAV